MIHICSLARLNETVATTGARHVATLLRYNVVPRPPGIARADHLVLRIDDIIDPLDGYTAPLDDHVDQLVRFVGRWDRATPIVFHCYAGISRSTAAAYTTVCALNPDRDEHEIARAIRTATPIAQPNSRFIALADKALGRRGRMIEAIRAIGPGNGAYEGVPFRLDLAAATSSPQDKA